MLPPSSTQLLTLLTFLALPFTILSIPAPEAEARPDPLAVAGPDPVAEADPLHPTVN